MMYDYLRPSRMSQKVGRGEAGGGLWRDLMSAAIPCIDSGKILFFQSLEDDGGGPKKHNETAL